MIIGAVAGRAVKPFATYVDDVAAAAIDWNKKRRRRRGPSAVDSDNFRDGYDGINWTDKTPAPRTFPTRPGGSGAAYNELTGQGVYILRDSSGKIRYVGRGGAPERLIAHSKLGSGKDDLVGEILFNNNLPAAQAPRLEQELMQMLGGPRSVKPSTSLRNKIQGIGEGNPNFLDLEFAADHELVIEALRRAGLLGR